MPDFEYAYTEARTTMVGSSAALEPFPPVGEGWEYVNTSVLSTVVFHFWRRRKHRPPIDGLPDWALDAVYVEVDVQVGTLDRLKMFLGWRCTVKVQTVVEHRIGRFESQAHAFVWRPPKSQILFVADSGTSQKRGEQ